MSDKGSVPRVRIDENTNKFVHVKVADATEYVWTWAGAEYHKDVFAELSDQLSAAGLSHEDIKVLGGGRIDFRKNEKTIEVYGFSQLYGATNNEDVKALIEKYGPKGCTVTAREDGY